MNYNLLFITPLVVALIMLVHSIVRNLGIAWLDHRVKLTLLEMLEKKPELLRSYHELEDLMENSQPESGPGRPLDLALTGTLLAVIGVVCVVLYTSFGNGRWAVGGYWGGVACVVLGFIVAVVGLVIRWLGRSPLERERKS